MSNNWEFYLTKQSGTTAAICLDLYFSQRAPVSKLSSRLVVTIFLNHARPDGMAAVEENDALFAVEDVLANALPKHCQFVGRITTQGKREFVFYCKPALPLDFLATVEAGPYELSWEIFSDPQWAYYRNILLPTAKQHHGIQNRRAVERLMENDDNLEISRKVFHMLFFKDDGSQQKFADAMQGEGFSVSFKQEQKGEDYPFGLELIRRDKVDLKSINIVCKHLYEAAEKLNGQYDGWETLVVPNVPLEKI